MNANIEAVRRLDSLEQELEHMRHELGLRQASPSSTTPSVAEPGLADEGIQVAPEIHDASRAFEQQPKDVSTQAISGVELPPHTVVQLIEEYVMKHFFIWLDKS